MASVNQISQLTPSRSTWSEWKHVAWTIVITSGAWAGLWWWFANAK